MPHIFISYSRKDIDFAQKIVDALAANNLDTWIDWKSIPKGEDWEQEIYRGIEDADAFMFLISPGSVTSEMCNKEIAHAVENAKRILPIFIADVDDNNIYSVTDNFPYKEQKEEICRRNFFKCRPNRDDFGKVMGDIQSAIQKDYDWLRYHTDLQVKALRWEQQKDSHRLLGGKDLQEAEEQLAKVELRDPQPTELQRRYILEGRRHQTRTRTSIIVISMAVTIALAFISVFALDQGNKARENQYAAETEKANTEEQTRLSQLQARMSRARELSAVSLSISDLYPVRRLLLSIEALNTLQPTDPAILDLQSTLYSSLTQMGGEVIVRDENNINTLEISNDKKWLAQGSKFGQKVILTDLSDPGESKSILLESGPVTSLAFSADNHWLATTGNANKIRLWDLQNISAEPMDLEQHDGIVTGLAFSPDGRWLMSGGIDQTILKWDLERLSEKPELFSTQNEEIAAIQFSASGRWLASIDDAPGDNSLYLWKFEKDTPPLLALKADCSSAGYGGTAVLLLFSPDERWLTTSCGGSNISAWDLENLDVDPVNMPDHTSVVQALAFSPDGQRLVSGGRDETIRVWDMQSPGDGSVTLGTHKGSVNTLAFSPDGDYLVSGGDDALIQIWDMRLWPYRYRTLIIPTILRGHEISVDSLLFGVSNHTGDERSFLISAGRDHAVRLWDFQQPVFAPILLSDILTTVNQNSIRDIKFSPDGQWLASAGYYFAMESYPADNIISLWDVNNMQEASIALTDTIVSPNPVIFSPDSQWLAYGSSSSIHMANLRQSPAEYREFAALNELVEVIAIDPGNQWLAAGGMSGTINLYDINSPVREPLSLDAGGWITAAAFSPDSRSLLTGSGPALRLVDIVDQQKDPIVLKGHAIRVSALVFHGEWLASAGWDNHVNLWKLDAIRDGNYEPTLLDHPNSTGAVNALVFSHDGHWLASAGDDGTICVWDISNPGNPPLIFEHEQAVNSISFSPDDTWLASGSDDGTARLWMVQSIIPSYIIVQSGPLKIGSVDFHPSGKWLAVAGEDSIIRVWNVDMKELLKNACEIAGRNFTKAEWDQYFPKDPYHVTCPQWASGE